MSASCISSVRPSETSKLTDDLEAGICRRLAEGATVESAAALAGISPSTAYSWLAEGRRPDGRPRLRQFAAAVEEARAESTLLALHHIQAAMRAGKWRAAAYFLERRFPENWRLEWRYDRYGRPLPRRAGGEPRPSGDAVAPKRMPPRLTLEVQTRISVAFRLGAFPAEAAAYAGLSRSTLYRWRAAARRPDAHPGLQDFLAEIEQAEADAAVEAVKAIRRSAGEGQWRAAVWLLERMGAERWGPVDRLGRRPTNPPPR